MDWKSLRMRLLPEQANSVLPPQLKLPMLPNVVLDFSRKSDDPNAGASELGRIIESDSGLTCELLRYANSSRYAGRSKNSTAQQAISRLGISQSKNFLLSAAVQQAMKTTKSKLINIQSFWLCNLERALLAREFARLISVDGELAYSASLLHDFLLPALANELFDPYFQFLQQAEAQRVPLVDYERRQFGWDHSLATASVLCKWGFPDELICCVRLHHGGLAVVADPQIGCTSAAAVALAALAPDPLRQSGDGLAELQKLEAVLPGFDLQATAQAVAVQLNELTPLGSQHLTLARRVEKLLAAAS